MGTEDSYENKYYYKFLEENDRHIDSIAVYGTPLQAPFASSSLTFRSLFQRQYFSVDYHAFIVLHTNHGQWLAIDKMRDGIYISEGESEDSVVFYFDEKPRPRPLTLHVRDDARSEEFLFLSVLREKMDCDSYEVVTKNCQHFCRDIFDKFALRKWWKFSTLVDITSPLFLFSKASISILLRVLASFCEIWFFFDRLRKGVANLSQFTALQDCYTPLASFIALFIAVVAMGHEEVSSWSLTLSAIGVSIFLIFEFILSRPFSAVKKRITQYCKMWKSGGGISKILLPLVLTFVYGQTIVRFFLAGILPLIGDTILYIVGASGRFSVEKFFIKLYNTVSEDYQLITMYIFSMMYFAYSVLTLSRFHIHLYSQL